jgi:hypothetical protein
MRFSNYGFFHQTTLPFNTPAPFHELKDFSKFGGEFAARFHHDNFCYVAGSGT